MSTIKYDPINLKYLVIWIRPDGYHLHIGYDSPLESPLPYAVRVIDPAPLSLVQRVAEACSDAKTVSHTYFEDSICVQYHLSDIHECPAEIRSDVCDVLYQYEKGQEEPK